VERIREGRGVYRFLVGRPGGNRPLVRPSVGGRITLRWTLGRQRSNWIRVVQEKVQWRAVVNAVIKRQGNFVTS